MVYMAYKDLYQMSNTEVGPHLWLWLCVIGVLTVKMAAVLCNPSSGAQGEMLSTLLYRGLQAPLCLSLLPSEVRALAVPPLCSCESPCAAYWPCSCFEDGRQRGVWGITGSICWWQVAS